VLSPQPPLVLSVLHSVSLKECSRLVKLSFSQSYVIYNCRVKYCFYAVYEVVLISAVSKMGMSSFVIVI
jgi:hypothetical protein